MKFMLVSLYGAPPVANAQSYRAGKIAKYLRKLGHEVIIVTHVINKRSVFDDRLKNDMERYGDVKVIRLKPPFIPPRYRLIYALNAVGIPDNYIFFALRNFGKIRALIESNNIECILTSNTPSGHILGSFLAQRLEIKWIADLADLWAENPYLYMPTKFHKSFQEKIERKILRKADMITYSAETWAEILSERFPDMPLCHIPNGYDPEEFLFVDSTANQGEVLKFCYFGTIYRNFDLGFLRAFVDFVKDNPTAKNLVKLNLIGQIAPNKHREILDLSNGWANIDISGQIPHFDMITEIMGSDFLIFSVGMSPAVVQYNPMPSRVPIYFGSGKPTIACCIPGSYVDSLFRRLGCWRVVDVNNIDSIRRSIEDAWDLFNSTTNLKNCRFWNSSSEALQWNGIIERFEEYLHQMLQ